MTIAKCTVQDCTEPGPWYPTLEMRAPYSYRSATAAPITLNLPHCESHRETTTIERLIDAEGWEYICSLFDSIGKVRPERERTSLRWLPFDDEAVRVLRAASSRG